MRSFPRSSDSDEIVPTAAGIYDCLLGCQYHSPADEQAAQKVLAMAPEARFGAVENRKFMQRAVRYVAAHGVRQYIDLGSGFPTEGAVHKTAGEIVADPHVVYVDYDPAVAELSRSMVRSENTLIVSHDLRHPWRIIEDPAVIRLIDWSQPVALLMVAILHFVTDDESPAEILATFRDHMCPGSYLVLSHLTGGENPDGVEKAAQVWDNTRSPLMPRTPREIEDLFVGFELVHPGLVTTTEWGTTEPAPTGSGVVLAGVARVP
jgi:hypothetical protein